MIVYLHNNFLVSHMAKSYIFAPLNLFKNSKSSLYQVPVFNFYVSSKKFLKIMGIIILNITFVIH